MNRLLNHVRGNVVAYLALFVALGGTSYAAVNLPDNSVGNPQLENGSITASKFDPKYIGGDIRFWAKVNASGHVIGGGHGIVVQPQQSVAGDYLVGPSKTETVAVPTRCTIVASVDYNAPVPGYADAELSTFPKPQPAWQAVIATFNSQGQQMSLPFDFVVVC